MQSNNPSRANDWIFLTILVLSSIVILSISSNEFYPADFNEWRKDWGVFKKYIISDSPIPFTELSKFTFAYLLNSFLSADAPRNLLWINTLYLFLPIFCLALVKGWRIAIAAGSIFILALIFSPIPTYYLFTGALEVQSGVVIGIFMSTLTMLTFSDKKVQPKSLLILLALSGFLLPTYKDTVLLVITFGFLFLALLHVFIQSFSAFPAPTRESVITVIKYGAIPTMLGFVVSASYNMAKYGLYLPVVYLIESRETSPDLYKSIEFFIASIFSPNGGLIVFWSLPILIMVWGWRMLGLTPQKSLVSLAVLCVVLTLFGLAKWWAPFGWDSWGNRLVIPSIFGLMVGMLLSLEPTKSSTGFTSTIFNKSNAYKLLLACPIAILSAYYLSVPYLSTSFTAAMQASLNPGPACRNMYRALQGEESNMGLKFWKSEIYYNCARERMMHLPTPS